MNIFEFAMQMETDGRNYYLNQAEKTDHPMLKKILLEMADDELKHYNIFKRLRDGHAAEYDEAKKTTIISSAKNIFQTMKDQGSDFAGDENVVNIWAQAREVEKKAEKFYREKADETDDDNANHILNRIADEEHMHWATIDNVINFLDKPNQFLENAEWNNLESL